VYLFQPSLTQQRRGFAQGPAVGSAIGCMRTPVVEKQTPVAESIAAPQPATNLLQAGTGIHSQGLDGRAQIQAGEDGGRFREQADVEAALRALAEQPWRALAHAPILLPLNAVFEGIKTGDEARVYGACRRRYGEAAFGEGEAVCESIEARGMDTTLRGSPDMIEAQTVDGDQQEVDDGPGVGGIRSGRRAP